MLTRAASAAACVAACGMRHSWALNVMQHAPVGFGYADAARVLVGGAQLECCRNGAAADRLR
jgi:hypothetical protein